MEASTLKTTLVLSSSYEPIDRVSWQKAITWVIQGRAEIIVEYVDAFIRTISSKFSLPSVIRLLSKVSRRFQRKGVKFCRRNIWLRDLGMCQYCGVKLAQNEFTYDHVVPRDQGGMTTWENIVCSCRRCNQRKANRTPKEASLKLQKVPSKPSSLRGGETLDPFRGKLPAEWRDFLVGYGYWTEELDRI